MRHQHSMGHEIVKGNKSASPAKKGPIYQLRKVEHKPITFDLSS